MRPKGRRNPKFEENRALLVGRLSKHVALKGAASISMRELAEHADTSVSNLQHYFEDREGVLKSVFAQIHQEGLVYLQRIPQLAEQHGIKSIEKLCQMVADAWKPGRIAKIHEAGLILGLGSAEFGPIYLNHILEPTLQAIEALCLELENKKLLRWKGDIRFAALALISPLLLSLLHQKGLGGSKCRKLDQSQLIKQHSKNFLAGWAVL